jgi:murein L,D-transpeptidase YcbB/YkuD
MYYAPSVAVTLDREPPPSTQSILRQVLAKKSAAQPVQVLAFYEARDFRPAWSGGAEEEEAAADVRAILTRAHEQGLRDEDYKLTRDNRPRASGAEAAAYEISLTSVVLRYAHDLRTGRVQPKAIYDDIKLPAANFDAVPALTRALNTHSAAKFLADLAPAHPEYRRLAKALARYRAIADAEGWPAVPGQNEVRLDGKDERLSVLIQRLSTEDPMLAAIAKPSTAEIRDAVKRFQARSGLNQDGRAGGVTLASLNVPAETRVDQIVANMERWRWMPRQFEHRYVAVNVPDQSVQYVRDGMVVLTSRVVVGRKASPTPITRSAITAVVVNPPWNIPGDIAARDLLPQLRKNPNYLASKRMVVTDGPQNDPYGRKIDWQKVAPAEFPYAIRQLPGPQTALGAVMLDSPNDFDVYLHDTPNKRLFDSTLREISNGCVRVQQIFPLASLALTDDTAKGMSELTKATKSRDTQRLTLDEPLPVYFLYWTAVAGPDGELGFRPDRYGRDTRLIAALTLGVNSATTRELVMNADADIQSRPQADISP